MSSTFIDKDSKSLTKTAEKEQSTRNAQTPEQEGSKKQRKDDFDRSIKMQESGINSPKPVITEQGIDKELVLDDPYKQSKGEFTLT